MMRAFLLFCFFSGMELASITDKLGPAGDRITTLPGVSQMPNFAMYSGYLDAGRGKELHYWFNEYEDGPTDILIVWFNGGPGCSSLDGLMTEHGPYKFDQATGRLVKNNYSWNKLAHTLYIETPGGVGFSTDDSQDTPSDDTVAVDTLRALLSFFEKFPSINDCDLYISGESYAGVYIPTLVAKIMDNQPHMAERIMGLVIGNGLMSSHLNDQSLIYYAYYHGLFGEETWRDLLENCCVNGRPDRCDFYQFKKEGCMMEVMKVSQIILNGGLNIYNLYQDCAPSEEDLLMNYFRESLTTRLWNEIQKFPNNSQAQAMLYGIQSSVGLIPPCSNATLVTDYFNRDDVQRAIHVKSMEWKICSDPVHGDYRKIYLDTSKFVKRILYQDMDTRVLLYFGDVDMACNHLGGEWFANQLGFRVTMPRRSWSIERNGMEQIAGFVMEFDKLTFATIKGAGHMVPADDPEASFQMLQRFIDYEPL